jgi:hypothetical protein
MILKIQSNIYYVNIYRFIIKIQEIKLNNIKEENMKLFYSISDSEN